MKVVGYVRVSLDCSVHDVMDRAAQERAIEQWARSGRHRLQAIFADEGPCASSGLESRVGLADALTAIRDGAASAVVVARLDRLAPDVILQECLLAEMERFGAQLCSAAPGEDREISEAVDPRRALVRETVRATAPFNEALRDLSIRRRVGHLPAGEDSERAALARIEQLAIQGLRPREIARILAAEGFRPRLARVFNLARLERIVAAARGSTPSAT